MGSRIDDTLYGWLIFDERYASTGLADNDASATGSDYAQTVPRPGVPELTAGTDSAVIQLSGGQSESVDVQVVGSGMPGTTGARVAIRGEDDAWLGWTFGELEQFETIEAPSLVAFAMTSVAGRATTGYPVAGYMPASGASAWSCRYFDGSAWQDGTGETGDATLGLALVALPSGRMLAVCLASGEMRVDYSDDGGATWSVYSRNALAEGSTIPNAPERMTAAYNDGEILVVCQRAGSNDSYQLASDDLGVSFQTVKNHTSFGSAHIAQALPSGGFGVWYIDASADPSYVRLTSAYQEMDEPTAVTIAAATATGLAAWADPSGTLYTLYHSTAWQMYRSLDAGTSWASVAGPWADAWGGSAYASDHRDCDATYTHLGALVITQWTPPTSTGVADDGLVGMWVGGWTNREHAYREGGSWGGSSFGYPASGRLWLGTETLANCNWTKTGTGTETLNCGSVTVAGIIRLASNANRDDGIDNVYDFVDCACTGGSPVTGDNQFFEIAIEDNGAAEGYLYKLRMSAAAWRLVDANDSDATLASATVDMTAGRQFFIGHNVIWHRARGARVWTKETFASVDGGYTGAYTLSYEGTQSLSSVTIRMLGRQVTVDGADDVETTVGGFVGRPLGRLGCPHPFGTSARIAMVDGPATTGTAWTVDPVHDYGLANALPDKGPSPFREWRSGVETEQIISWALPSRDSGRWLGVYVERPRFRTAYLDQYDGSTWLVSSTIDCAAGFESLDYVRPTGTAGVVTPATSPATDAARFIQADELVGGYLILPSNKCRVITGNTAGSWAASAHGGPRPRIYFDGADGTEASSGSLAIVPPQALCLDYRGTATITHVRLRIPAQDAPDDSIGAGLILVGHLHLAGAAPDWGWGEETVLSVDRTVSAQGTPRASELGPPRRVWSWSWTEGVDLSLLRSTLDLDYLGPTDGSAGTTPGSVADQDVWWQLTGLVSMTQSGTLPVVAIRGVPDGDVTLNDPTRMLYSYIDGGPSVTGLAGTEGADEAVRIGTITMRGIK